MTNYTLPSEIEINQQQSTTLFQESSRSALASPTPIIQPSLRFHSHGIKEISLIWKDLNKFIDLEINHTTKQILYNITGSAQPGEMVALMGPSGSGKTTLLNILGGRGRTNLKGIVYLNQEPFKKSLRRTIAYVMQEDIFYLELTIRQQLIITSHLRLPSTLTNEEKIQAVNHVIQTLRLEKCADTTIELVSGGERKRCNIGTELLTNPSILLLDEPTSGLDSTAAHSLIETMRSLAVERMTLISSIHQPSSKIFYSFDKLVLLADGQIIYNGPPQKCMHHLSTLKFVPDASYNPADYLMDLVNDTEEVEAMAMMMIIDPNSESGVMTTSGDLKQGESSVPLTPSAVPVSSTSSFSSCRARLIAGWNNTPIEHEVNQLLSLLTSSSYEKDSPINESENETNGSLVKYPASYSTQFLTLLGRALIVSQSKSMTHLQFYQTIGLGIISGLCWWDMPYTENTIIDRAGFIFFFMTFWFFMTLFQGMMQFLPERIIILKERASGSYRLSAYFLSKTISELPIRLSLPLLYLMISFPMTSLAPTVKSFCQVASILLLSALAGESIGVFIGTITLDYEKAMVIALLVSLILILTGGFFVQNLPIFVHWVRFVSPAKYSYDSCLRLVYYENIKCDQGDILVECSDPTVKEVSPEAVWNYLGQQGTVGFNVGLLILFIIFFRIAAYLAMRYIPHNNGRK
jgi:ABC-type multidrug transport system ATPase subunit/ABC-type multidrug transport system permease subunit